MGAPRTVELWMISNVATGAATASFLSLLIPPFVTAETGSSFRTGIVFAVISLSAVVGPFVGKIADRTGRHRLFYTLALLVMAASFGLLAIDAAMAYWSPIFGVLIGVAYATQGTIGPAFIVGAGLPNKTVAAQLTTFNLAFPVGQVLGALIVAAALALGLTAVPIFLIAAATIALLTLVTIPALATPARRMADNAQAASPTTDTAPAGGGASTKTSNGTRVLLSSFGVMLVIVVVSSVGNNGLQSQLANLMPAVYGFTSTATALLVGFAGLLNIGVIVVAGAWMARSGSLTVYAAGTILRAVGAGLMLIMAMFTSPILLIAALAMLITYQGTPIPRLAASDLSVKLAPTTATQANGYYFAASAIGSILGCLLAGIFAEVDYTDVLWLATVAGVAAVVLTLVWLIPASRKRRSVRQATL